MPQAAHDRKDKPASLHPRASRELVGQCLGALRYLPAVDASRVLDEVLWKRVVEALSCRAVTSAFTRESRCPRVREELACHARWCAALAGALLEDLAGDEAAPKPQVDLLCLIAGRDVDRPALLDHDLALRLAARPGHAFALLAAHESDNAISLVARDAFLRAMFGKETSPV